MTLACADWMLRGTLFRTEVELERSAAVAAEGASLSGTDQRHPRSIGGVKWAQKGEGV